MIPCSKTEEKHSATLSHHLLNKRKRREIFRRPCPSESMSGTTPNGTNFFDYIDYTKPSFLHALVCILIAPIIWNIIARLEFYTHFLTKITRSPYYGCYLLALWIFCFSLYRDVMYTSLLMARSDRPTPPHHPFSISRFENAVAEQLKHPEIDTPLVKGVACVLFASGSIFVLSSMWAR